MVGTQVRQPEDGNMPDPLDILNSIITGQNSVDQFSQGTDMLSGLFPPRRDANLAGSGAYEPRYRAGTFLQPGQNMWGTGANLMSLFQGRGPGSGGGNTPGWTVASQPRQSTGDIGTGEGGAMSEGASMSADMGQVAKLGLAMLMGMPMPMILQQIPKIQLTANNNQTTNADTSGFGGAMGESVTEGAQGAIGNEGPGQKTGPDPATTGAPVGESKQGAPTTKTKKDKPATWSGVMPGGRRDGAVADTSGFGGGFGRDFTGPAVGTLGNESPGMKAGGNNSSSGGGSSGTGSPGDGRDR